MGIILGLPLGVLLIYFITQLLEFGAVADIKLMSYIFTVVFVILFILFVDLLLVRKIKKIDMTTSLKSVE